MSGDFKIIPLTHEFLEDSYHVIKDIFEGEGKHIRKELEASIDIRNFEKYIKYYDDKIVSIAYYLAVNKENRVLGTVGLYELINDVEDSCWIGWYCVKKEERGKGIGVSLLEFVIRKARLRNKKYLKIYSSTCEGEGTAQGIYEKYGFKITKVEKTKYHYILYRRKVL